MESRSFRFAHPDFIDARTHPASPTYEATLHYDFSQCYGRCEFQFDGKYYSFSTHQQFVPTWEELIGGLTRVCSLVARFGNGSAQGVSG